MDSKLDNSDRKKTMAKGKQVDDTWQQIASDPISNLSCTSSCIAFADVDGQGENKIAVLDLKFEDKQPQLKIFSGGALLQHIHGFPCGVISFKTHQDATAPAIAVASGNALFVFKNMQPFYKFLLPDLPVNHAEVAAWKEADNEQDTDLSKLNSDLQCLRSSGLTLSSRSLRFLGLKGRERIDFFTQHKNQALVSTAVVTCMCTLAKLNTDENAVACPVLGTESGTIFVLNPANFSAVVRVEVSGAISCITASGALDVDYRIHVCTRSMGVYAIKGGHLAGTGFDIPAAAVGIDRLSKSLLIGCANHVLYCFTPKGRTLWQIKMPAPISSQSSMMYKAKMLRATLIGLQNGEIRIYTDKGLLNTSKIDGSVTALRFGHILHDTYVLACVTGNGSFILHQLQRGSEFKNANSGQGPPSEQQIRIKVPTKTKLYVDQTQRERDNAISMHRSFRRDYYVLQVLVARNYVKALTSSLAPTELEDFKLQVGATVKGIGPLFRLTINIRNIGAKLAKNIRVMLVWDDTIYDIPAAVATLPCMVPGTLYTPSFVVQCATQELVSSTIHAHVYSPHRSLPIVTAVVAMPISEPVITVR